MPRLGDKPMANPLVVLREEFDDWAVLFDPDTGNAFGLNPVGVFIWKLLDGRHTADDIVLVLASEWSDAPENAREHVAELVESLVTNGLAGYKIAMDR